MQYREKHYGSFPFRIQVSLQDGPHILDEMREWCLQTFGEEHDWKTHYYWTDNLRWSSCLGGVAFREKQDADWAWIRFSN
jgi:hypothetical protein